MVSYASLYVYNNQTAGNNHSTIVNQIYGTASTNKVVYSLGVGNTNTLSGWSIYRTGDVNTLKFNDKWDATGNDRLTIDASGNTTIAGNLTVSGATANIATANTGSTINIGTGTANNTVNIATNASGTHSIGIGNTNSTTTINGAFRPNLSGVLIGAGTSANATAQAQLSVANGGTGLSSCTSGQVLFGNSTTALSSSSSLIWDNTNIRLNITGSGETTPTGYTVNIGGNLGVSKDISAFASDVRLKNITSKINAPLKIINNISGFYYKFNEIAQEYNLDPDNKLHVGVSAQDVQSVLPEIVELAPFDTSNLPSGEKVSRSGQNYLTIKYDKLTPVLIEGVKELENRIENQNNIIKTQNTVIADLKDSIEYLKNEISLLKQSS